MRIDPGYHDLIASVGAWLILIALLGLIVWLFDDWRR